MGRDRRLSSSAAICLAVALTGARADAASVLFDFDLLPDAVFSSEDDLQAGVATPLGCSEPVSSSNIRGAYAVCDADDEIQNMEFGIAKGYVHTVEGLTLTLTAKSTTEPWMESIDWLGGTVACGNAPDCFPFVADFSTPLISAQVQVLRVEERGGGAELPFTILQTYLEAWSGPTGTGSLLGRVELPGSLAPLELAFTAPEGMAIGSLLFGATTTNHGNCHRETCDNLAVIDNLVVTPVPEPASALLVGLGLLALGAARARAASPRFPLP